MTEIIPFVVSVTSLAVSVYSVGLSWFAQQSADAALKQATIPPNPYASPSREEIELRLTILKMVMAGAQSHHIEQALALWRFTHGRAQAETKTEEG